MALLVVAGLPSSGRSTRVADISRTFENAIRDNAKLSRVAVVTDDDAHAGRDVYESRQDFRRVWLTCSAARRRTRARSIPEQGPQCAKLFDDRHCRRRRRDAHQRLSL